MNRGRVRVKICGHTRPADIDASIQAGADAIGVITDVSVETPRAVNRDTARDLLATIPPFVTGVAVTMPENATEALRVVDAVQPDALQVHGPFPPDELQILAARIDIPLIRALAVTDRDAIKVASEHADGILLDNVDDDGGGGTGEQTDWTRAAELVRAVPTPIILAGGLTPDTVADAIRTVRPYGVDVASGVEANGGVKNHDAVHRFVRESMTTAEVSRQCQ